MKFSQYIRENINESWVPMCLDYQKLKSKLRDIRASLEAKKHPPQHFHHAGHIEAQDLPTLALPSSGSQERLPLLDSSAEAHPPTLMPNPLASASLSEAQGGEPIPSRMDIRPQESRFLSLFREEVEKVSSFYESKTSEFAALLQVYENECEARSNLTRRQVNQVKQSFVKFYHDLERLQSYTTINYLAAIKMARRFKKISSRKVHLIFEVDSQAFHRCTELKGVIGRATKLFTSHFEGGNSARALHKLKRRDVDVTPKNLFILGLFGGISLACALPVLYLIILSRHGRLQSLSSDTVIMASVYRGLGLVVFFLWLWGAAIWVFCENRVNHMYILQLDQKTAVNWVHVWKTSAVVTALMMITVVLWIMRVDPDVHVIPARICPLIFLVGLVLLFLCPFHIFHRASRKWIFITLARIAAAPFVAVKFRDFFVADILTSMVKLVSDWEFAACYYCSGEFIRDKKYDPNLSTCNQVRRYSSPVVMVLPYMWRFLQCLRMYRDTRRAFPHLVNAGKYFTCILAVIAGAVHSLELPAWHESHWPRIIWAASLILSSTYCFLWDIFMDWGLGRCKSKNFLLRDELYFKTKIVYYLVMIMDLCLRFCWALSISPRVHWMSHELWQLAFAAGEIIRRATWAIFRIENEAVNNFEQYRADQYVPPAPVGGVPHRCLARRRVVKKMLKYQHPLRAHSASSFALVDHTDLATLTRRLSVDDEGHLHMPINSSMPTLPLASRTLHHPTSADSLSATDLRSLESKLPQGLTLIPSPSLTPHSTKQPQAKPVRRPPLATPHTHTHTHTHAQNQSLIGQASLDRFPEAGPSPRPPGKEITERRRRRRRERESGGAPGQFPSVDSLPVTPPLYPPPLRLRCSPPQSPREGGTQSHTQHQPTHPHTLSHTHSSQSLHSPTGSSENLHTTHYSVPVEHTETLIHTHPQTVGPSAPHLERVEIQPTIGGELSCGDQATSPEGLSPLRSPSVQCLHIGAQQGKPKR